MLISSYKVSSILNRVESDCPFSSIRQDSDSKKNHRKAVHKSSDFYM